MEENNGRIPLALAKQAFMKLESAMSDINEIKEDPDMTEREIHMMESVSEMLGTAMSVIINLVSEELGEDEFLSEEINMDKIDPYPGDDIVIDDESI